MSESERKRRKGREVREKSFFKKVKTFIEMLNNINNELTLQEDIIDNIIQETSNNKNLNNNEKTVPQIKALIIEETQLIR